MPVPHVRRMRILRTLPVHLLPESWPAFRFRLIVPSKSYSAINPISINSSNPEIDEPLGHAEKNLLGIILFIPEFVGNGFQNRRSEDVQTRLRLRVHPVPNLKGLHPLVESSGFSGRSLTQRWLRRGRVHSEVLS